MATIKDGFGTGLTVKLKIEGKRDSVKRIHDELEDAIPPIIEEEVTQQNKPIADRAEFDQNRAATDIDHLLVAPASTDQAQDDYARFCEEIAKLCDDGELESWEEVAAVADDLQGSGKFSYRRRADDIKAQILSSERVDEG